MSKKLYKELQSNGVQKGLTGKELERYIFGGLANIKKRKQRSQGGLARP